MALTIAAVIAGDPTNPCCCTGSCAVKCQSKSGIGQLIGISEFGSPSIPPKMYLKQLWDGVITLTRYYSSDASCSGDIIDTTVMSQGGAAIYDPVTGLLTNTSWYNSVPPNRPEYGMTPGSGNVWDRFGPTTVTQTSQVTACSGVCQGSYPDSKVTGGASTDLDTPDTLDNAMVRAMQGLTWAPCDCGTCTSWMTKRGSTDISVGFQRLQIKAGVASVPGVTYQVTVKLGERPTGSAGALVDDGMQLVFSVTCDAPAGTTDWSGWQDIPCEEGVEIGVIGCSAAMVG